MIIENIYKKFLEFPSISTDSRIIKKNDIFWALKGENFDGNEYIDEALRSSASYAISDNKNNKDKKRVIYVKDSLKALQYLAKHHRNQLKTKIIAITGPGLVFIEGGAFQMGKVEQDMMYTWNNMQRRVTVSSYYMDETEVQNVDYLEYLFWLSRVFIDMPQIYEDALPDTLPIWNARLL